MQSPQFICVSLQNCKSTIPPPPPPPPQQADRKKEVSSLLLIAVSSQLASGQLSGSECSEDILTMMNVLSLFALLVVPCAQISLLSFTFNSVPTLRCRNGSKATKLIKKIDEAEGLKDIIPKVCHGAYSGTRYFIKAVSLLALYISS